MLLQEVQGGIRRRYMQDTQTAMEESMATAPASNARRLIQGTKMGDWLTVLMSTVVSR